MSEPNHIIARKIWMLAAKWQEKNPSLNLYHQKAKLELTRKIEELLKTESKPEPLAGSEDFGHGIEHINAKTFEK
jgi:hypothetical protein